MKKKQHKTAALAAAYTKLKEKTAKAKNNKKSCKITRRYIQMHEYETNSLNLYRFILLFCILLLLFSYSYYLWLLNFLFFCFLLSRVLINFINIPVSKNQYKLLINTNNNTKTKTQPLETHHTHKQFSLSHPTITQKTVFFFCSLLTKVAPKINPNHLSPQ